MSFFFPGEPIINKIFPLPAMVAAMDLFAKLVESSPAFCASVAKELGMDILRSLELYPSNSRKANCSDNVVDSFPETLSIARSFFIVL